MAQVDNVTEIRADLGEGPCWDNRSGVLLFVDITRGELHRYDPARGATQSIALGQEIGAAVPRTSGGLVVALRDGVATLENGELRWIAPIESQNHSNRANDAKCDSKGRLWVGTMAFDMAPAAGSLYRVDVDHSWHRAVAETTISNGIAWSPDDSRMYYIDSGTRRVDVFDFDPESGELTSRRPFIQFVESDGVPDGMTVDADGAVWVAMWGGACLRRIAPSGREIDRIELPVTQVTSCAFGGPDLTDLYVTTARIGLSSSEVAAQPLAGALFRCMPGVRGLPVSAFLG